MQFICGREGERKEKSKGFGGIGRRRWAQLSREEDAKGSGRVREAGREGSVKIEEWSGEGSARIENCSGEGKSHDTQRLSRLSAHSL
jgi:hypothetical protein